MKWLFFLPLLLFSHEMKHLVSIGGGVFDLLREKHRTAEFRIEYRPPYEWMTFRPTVGAMATAKGASYFYGGFGFEWFLQHFFFSPNFAIGCYLHGEGKNLGFPLEFRSGIEVGWENFSLYRMGVHFYHVSNASLGKRNPGEESLEFFVAIPFGKRR